MIFDYLCGMKHWFSLYKFCAVATLAAVTACGSSRQATRHSSEPDRRTAALDRAYGAQQMAQRTANKKLTPTQRLAARLDSLLVTADTMLQTTQLGMQIVDITTGECVYAIGEQQRMRPASAEKVMTAITALDVLGPNYAFTTQLMTTATTRRGVLNGDLYIKGGMDPLLSTADVKALAQQLKAAGITTINGALIADASMKDEDELGWGWCWDDENPTLTPLLCNGKPGLTAELRTALKRAGVTLKKGVKTGVTPNAAHEVAAVRRPLTSVLQPMMKESDNLCAEAVFYQIRKDRTVQNNRKVAAAMIYDVMTRAEQMGKEIIPSTPSTLTTSSTIADGSGLSLYNYQTPEIFTQMLRYAVSRPDSILNPLLEAMPIAAVDGTLKKRMAGTAAAGNVRAKTGSVSAVSTLAGYTTQRSTGHLMAFAIMNQGLKGLAQGRNFQDKVCILLSE